MNDLKANYDRVALIALALIAVAASYFIASSAEDTRSRLVPLPQDAKHEAFAGDAAVATLKSDQSALAERRDWRESKASPFVSRVYLLKDDRLVDILESGNDLFPGISNSWILEHDLDYLDAGLPDRDPDSDGFTNLEEFIAKTNPHDAASKPAIWTKLRLVSVQEQTLESVLKTLVSVSADLHGSSDTGEVATAEFTASDKYDAPPDDEAGNPRSNPPDFSGKSVQVQLAPGVFAQAKVVGQQINDKTRTFTVQAKLELRRAQSPRPYDALTGLKAKGGGAQMSVGAWINSQAADKPGTVKGQSAKYLLGQLLYVNEFVPGKATPDAKETPFRLLSVSTEKQPAPELGPNATKEVDVAVLESTVSHSAVTSLKKNITEKSPYALATLQDTRPGGASFEARTGETFPLGETLRYKLVDVSEEGAIIEDSATKEQHTVPRAANAGAEAVTTPPEVKTP